MRAWARSLGCFAADLARGLIASGPASVGPPESVVLPAPGAYRGIAGALAPIPRSPHCPVLSSIQDTTALPNAREFARLGALRLQRDGGMDPADLSPCTCAIK